jgi:transposase-like protein
MQLENEIEKLQPTYHETTQPVTKKIKIMTNYNSEFKKKVIKEWKESGLNARQFSTKENIPYATFSNWVRKVHGSTVKSWDSIHKAKPRKSIFHPLVTAKDDTPKLLLKDKENGTDKTEIVINGNIKLYISNQTNPEIIIQIIKGLTK